tara:strand:- start:223 stop:471 length:249 start_codon:yes stop_codon:yes gene_type:complete
MWGRTNLPITQAKTGHNAVAVARARDAIGITVAEAGMTDDLRAKAGAINADHVMMIAGGRGTSGVAIRVVENLNAHRRRSCT